MRCWFSMRKQYGQEPQRRLPTASSRRLEVSCVALDRRASPSRTSTWRSGCFPTRCEGTFPKSAGLAMLVEG